MNNSPFGNIPIFIFLLIITCGQPAGGAGTKEYVATSYADGDFKLVWENFAADLYVSQGETPAVLRCARDFVEDVKRITGKLPALKHQLGNFLPMR